MSAHVRRFRALAAFAALSVSLPALAQESQPYAPPPPPPPPPESLPWAAPARPAPPAHQSPPVYRPDYTYGPRRVRPTYQQPSYQQPYEREQAWYPHLEVAVRGGLATPGGSAMSGLSMSDVIGEQLTLGVELGIRATPQLTLAAFLEGGVGGPGTHSSVCVSSGCDVTSASARVGILMRYHLAPYAPVDPWFGIGMAVAGSSASGRDAAGDFDYSFSGFEFPKLSVGADLRLAGHTSLGLFAEWSYGAYGHAELKENGAVTSSGTIDQTTGHSWFMIGPRLTF